MTKEQTGTAAPTNSSAEQVSASQTKPTNSRSVDEIFNDGAATSPHLTEQGATTTEKGELYTDRQSSNQKIDLKTEPVAHHPTTPQNQNTEPISTVTPKAPAINSNVQSSEHKSQPKANCKAKNDRNFRCITSVLLSITLVASVASLAYCIWDYCTGGNTIHYSYSGTDGNIANFTEGSIAEVAAKVTPGVVSILTEIQTQSFFGQSTTSTAAGTGMIVTKDGYVLTNKHVIDGAKTIRIVLDDGTTFDKVNVVATDPLNDVAYLKIADASDLPTVTLGNSKTITAGQQVIAIGNALGQFQNTITSGIISGTGRIITATNEDYSNAESLTDMIQTDAAINAGNSGGPLVNAAGEVIGINTATSSDADGIGFAIPITSVKGMLKSIIANGSAERPYLGVRYVAITPDIAAEYELPVSSGAYVYTESSRNPAVISGGPADKAGLKDKDIITKINGVTVGSAGSVSTLVGEYMPGETIQLTVLRDGKEIVLNVTLGSYQE